MSGMIERAFESERQKQLKIAREAGSVAPPGSVTSAVAAKAATLSAIRNLNLKSLIVSAVVFAVAFLLKLGVLTASILAVLAQVIQLVI